MVGRGITEGELVLVLDGVDDGVREDTGPLAGLAGAGRDGALGAARDGA